MEKVHSYIYISVALKANEEHCVALSHERNPEANSYIIMLAACVA